jgi:hypothetical protein
VQTVHLINSSAADNPFGPAPISFAGAPDFSPTRIAIPGPNGFPLAKFEPGAVAGPGYSPFIRIDGSDTVYNAPIIATGDGPYDVVNHTNTADRVLGIHIAGPSQPGQFAESWVDMLFVKGFDAGQPIVYLSTDAGQPLTAVLERSTYVPALNDASCNGCDDFLGSAPRAALRFHQRSDRPSRPPDRCQPGHRPAPTVRFGRSRHQLRRHRLHSDGPYSKTWPVLYRDRGSRPANCADMAQRG